MMANLTGQVVRMGHLDHNAISDIYRLHRMAHENVNNNSFHDELNSTDQLLLIREGGRICGFSVFRNLVINYDKTIRIIYSGDTVVERKYWSTLILQRIFAKKVMEVKNASTKDLYWFRAIKTFRTYRYFPIMFKEYFPRFDKKTPQHMNDLINVLGRKMFLDDYDEKRQIVRSNYRIKDDYEIKDCPNSSNNQDLTYFLQRNPHYAKGEEMVCIAKLELNNIKESFSKRLNIGRQDQDQRTHD